MNKKQKRIFFEIEKGDNQLFFFRLINNIRSRIGLALSSKSKSSSTNDILSKNFDTYESWMEYQFTLGTILQNIEIDLVRPISSINVSSDEELNEILIGKTLSHY